MARLSLEKQEKFATYIAAGYTQMAAYKEAGYTCKNSSAAANASKLLSEPTVAARVEELKIKAAEKSVTSVAPPLPVKKKTDDPEIDLAWLNNEYIRLLNDAKEANDIKNAVTILKDMAELNKVRPEKTEVDNNRTQPPYASSNMGPQINISLIDSKSQEDGGIPSRPFAIEIPDPEPVFIGDNSIHEDSDT